jgi:hypothetical protein
MKINILAISSLLLLAGCSTVSSLIPADEQTVPVAVVDSESLYMLPDATCQAILSGTEQKFDMDANPGELALPSNIHKLYLNCSAPGYEQDKLAVSNKVNRWAMADLTFLPGYITKSNLELFKTYPANIVVLMYKDAQLSADQINKNYQESQQQDQFFQQRRSSLS